MLDNREMRAVYSEVMIDLAKRNKRIVMLDADLMGSMGTKAFKAEYPKRHINVGIAEANMVGIAAGLASCGKIPFCHSFTPFVTRRCYDQIDISVAYANQNVKLVGADPGIMAQNNGGTHMSLEDVGIMRAMPNMTIFEPVDATMLKALLPQVVKCDKPMYIRLFRKKATTVFDENTKFHLFKCICRYIYADCCSGVVTGYVLGLAIIKGMTSVFKGWTGNYIDFHSILYIPVPDIVFQVCPCFLIVFRRLRNHVRHVECIKLRLSFLCSVGIWTHVTSIESIGTVMVVVVEDWFISWLDLRIVLECIVWSLQSTKV